MTRKNVFSGIPVILVLGLALATTACSTKQYVKPQPAPEEEPTLSPPSTSQPTTSAPGASQASGGASGNLSLDYTYSVGVSVVFFPFKTLQVYYATDRKRIPGGDYPNYSTQRNETKQPMQYGELDVTIPISHVVGETEVDPDWYKYFHKHSPEKFIEIHAGHVVSEGELKGVLRDPGGPDGILLFVHGYNNTFDEAAIRTAQIGHDVGFRGRLMFFSWPSMGKTSLYTYDRNNEGWASTDLAQLLRVIDQSSGLEHLTVIAHSMGNQALADALEELAASDPTLVTKIGHIIMAAPDVDAGQFTRKFASIFMRAPSTTLYMSSKDYALMSSEELQGGVRLGDERNGPLTYPPIDTIDASLVSMGFIGHAYISDSKCVLDDVAQIITTGDPASKRPHLVQAANGEQQPYWRLQAATH